MKSGLRKSLLYVTVIPIILFGIIIIVYSSNQMTKAIYQEVESGLRNVAQTVLYVYEKDYPGEYRMEKDTSEIYKGDQKISEAYEILDTYKEISGTDITIFYQDLRILTTICSSDGERIVGTKANAVVTKEVMKQKKERFYTKTKISSENYFSYYCPVYDSTGECIGMVFAGKPSQYVTELVLKKVIPIATIILIAVFVIILIMWHYSRHLTKSMQQLQSFITKVENGDFTAALGKKVAERKDELGMIGRSAIQMQSSLRDLVEKDSLTGLYNRHYGEVWLKRIKKESADTGTHFYVAIADIDFFKKFNDKYGHDCGDLVLKQVSSVLQASMKRVGYAARWGGEEFLLLFTDVDDENAQKRVNGVADTIRGMKIRYGGGELNVTVTIGMTAGDAGKGEDEIIKIADNALYRGKENGRDQVVVG
jgi:diguanylate cyclase (GGDEF)-like protein